MHVYEIVLFVFDSRLGGGMCPCTIVLFIVVLSPRIWTDSLVFHARNSLSLSLFLRPPLQLCSFSVISKAMQLHPPRHQGGVLPPQEFQRRHARQEEVLGHERDEAGIVQRRGRHNLRPPCRRLPGCLAGGVRRRIILLLVVPRSRPRLKVGRKVGTGSNHRPRNITDSARVFVMMRVDVYMGMTTRVQFTGNA